jgi:histone H3/H4
MSNTTADKKVTKRSKGSSNHTVKDFKFEVYVYRVLKQVHPDTGISGAALSIMVNLVKVDIAKVVKVINQLLVRSGAKTVTSRDVQSAVRLCLPGELAKHAVSEGTKAVTKYNAELTDGPVKVTGKKAKPEQRSHKAGITFNVTRVEKLMSLEASAKRKSASSGVYLAAVIEYLTAEILDLAGNAARDFKKVRITPRHIKLAIANDEELSKLYSDTVIGGGVVPRIHKSLLPTEKEEPKVKKPRVKEVAKGPAKKKAVAKKASPKKKPVAKPKEKSSSSAEKVPVASPKKKLTKGSGRGNSTRGGIGKQVKGKK